MFRKPLFWVAFALLALGCAWFTRKYFAQAFPIVSVDLRMDRAGALARARELDVKNRLGPPGFREVASFQRDQEVQNFVELEAGGTTALRNMFTSGLYHPFKWVVRHFKEGEARESQLWFTPSGAPYGFTVKLPEKEPGAALVPAEARKLAEEGAAKEWGVVLSGYSLVESSREVRPGGRVDHAFVYERANVQIGAGRYRLRLMVGGDRLTEVRHFVQVPEAFSRRYEQLRSANSAIGAGAAIAMVLLYMVGGCAVGLFFLMRQRWIIWRAPLYWGLFIGFLQMLAAINSWPLRWLGYDTAVSVAGFTAQQLAMLGLSFVLYTFVFSLSFMAAESLSRRAFPHHLQLWRLWSREVAASKTMLGRTLAAYMLVAVFFAYEVVLYFVTTRHLGWWTPSDALVDPDVLASYLPWLSAIAVSSQAGFWEETLFRAVPLAGAALLGARFGRRNWWIAGAMILQAVVFGAGHASYANQPSYARMVELVIPSFIFGGLYLTFGLWPSIVMHFAYDVVWFAIPIFVSAAPGIWTNRVLLILFALVPLWVVFAARMRARKWIDVSDTFRNGAWIPGASTDREPALPPALAAPVSMPRYLRGAGAVGLIAWAVLSPFPAEAPRMRATRSEAEATARNELAKRGVQLGPEWKVMPAVAGTPGEPHRFIWQTAGRDTYRDLLGTYLPEPRRTVRFARFEGDVAERAEEYLVSLSPEGQVKRFRHTLPEDRPGPSLPEENARILAERALADLFQARTAQLKEVSASPSRLKNRTDWLFTFSDTARPLKQGEARIGIQIAGDSLVDGYRFVHVPEDWSRAERDRRVIPNVIEMGARMLVLIAAVAGVIAAIVSWSRRRFGLATFLSVLTLGAIAGGISLINRFPSLSAEFSTAQPYKLQAGLVIIGGLIATLLLAAGISVLGGFASAWCVRAGRSWGEVIVAGLSLGTVAAGISAALARFGPRLSPAWPNYAPLGTYSPALNALAEPVLGYFGQAVLLSLFLIAIDRITANWSRRRAVGFVLFVAAGLVAAGSVETVLSWLIAGVAMGLFMWVCYVLVLRADTRAAFYALGGYQMLAIAGDGVSGAFPGAALLAGVRILVVLACAWVLYRRFATTG